MSLKDSDKRLKRTPDNDKDKMKAKAKKVLLADVPIVKFYATGSEREEWLALRNKYMIELDLSMGEAGEQATDELGYHIRDLK